MNFLIALCLSMLKKVMMCSITDEDIVSLILRSAFGSCGSDVIRCSLIGEDFCFASVDGLRCHDDGLEALRSFLALRSGDL